MIRLPGLCIVCREPVVWNGKRWKNVGQRGTGRHVCFAVQPTCGEWMPQARERCAKQPGHIQSWHRSAYALENARAARTKRWTECPPETSFVDPMARKNLDNGAVKTTITEVQR